MRFLTATSLILLFSGAASAQQPAAAPAPSPTDKASYMSAAALAAIMPEQEKRTDREQQRQYHDGCDDTQHRYEIRRAQKSDAVPDPRGQEQHGRKDRQPARPHGGVRNAPFQIFIHAWSPPVAVRGELLKAFSVQVEAETRPPRRRFPRRAFPTGWYWLHPSYRLIS